MSARARLAGMSARLAPQWDRERRDTLVLLCATLLSVVPHLAHLPMWASAGFCALFVWRLALALTGRPLPPDPVRWMAAAGCGAAVLAQYGTVLGSDPGVALLVLAMGLKLLELRARRDLFVVIFLGFFLLLTGFFHSQSIPTAAMTLAAVLALLVAMQTMQFADRQPTLGWRIRAVGLLLLQALPIAAALFLLFPRIAGPLWRMPLDASRGVTGLSDSMSPGQISALLGSDEVAFRARFEGREPERRELYWRGPVLGHYDGRTWRPATLRAAQREAGPTIERGPSEALRYAITLEPNGRPWLLALEAPLRIVEPPPSGAVTTSEMLIVAREPVSRRVRYVVESDTGYRLAPDEARTDRDRYLRLPPGSDPRSVALARQWRDEVSDDLARLQRVLLHFRTEAFRYTLEPGTLGRDAVDEFLFSSRAGFCEHYAGALVILARAMGIPARVVTGYHGGERNPLDGVWTIRQSDAHAWAEVWIDGPGWIRVDPTSAIDPSRVEPDLRSRAGVAEGGGAELLWWTRIRFGADAVANAWNQWVLAYDTGRQERLLARLGLEGTDWRGVVGLLAATVAGCVGALALLTLRRRRTRDPTVRCYETFCRRLERRGIVRAAHETPGMLLTRARPALDPESARLAERIVALYEALRYGRPASEQAEGVRHLRELTGAFKP